MVHLGRLYFNSIRALGLGVGEWGSFREALF